MVVVNNNAKHRQDAEGENRLIVDDHVKTPRSISRCPPSSDWMGSINGLKGPPDFGLAVTINAKFYPGAATPDDSNIRISEPAAGWDRSDRALFRPHLRAS